MYAFGSLNEPNRQSIFSNKVLISLRTIDASDYSEEIKLREIKKQINIELTRLNSITESIDSEISVKEKSASRYFELRDQLGDLKEDHAKVGLYQTMQRTVLQKLEASSLNQNST